MLKKFSAGACLGAVLTLGLGQQADAMSVDRYNLIDAEAGVSGYALMYNTFRGTYMYVERRVEGDLPSQLMAAGVIESQEVDGKLVSKYYVGPAQVMNGYRVDDYMHGAVYPLYDKNGQQADLAGLTYETELGNGIGAQWLMGPAVSAEDLLPPPEGRYNLAYKNTGDAFNELMSLAFLRGVVFYDEDMSQRSNKYFEMSYVDDASAYEGVAQGGDYAYDKIVVRDKNTYDLLGTYLVEKHGRYVYSLQGNQATAWYDEEHPF